MRSLALLAALALGAAPAAADWFGTGENRFEIPFVTIGDPGNPADTVEPNPFSAPLPTGTVDYVYRIGKYEVPEEAVRKANAQSELDGDPLGLTLDQRGPGKPATGMSWYEAARFVNWLNEDKGYEPAYRFDAAGAFQLWEPNDPGFSAANPFRNTRAYYFLPSADEWHKAAYYDPQNGVYWLYPYGSNEVPTSVESGDMPGTAVFNQHEPAVVWQAGGESPYGVVGMAGNVYDFEESTRDLLNADPRAPRGGNGSAWIFDTDVAISSAFRNSGAADAAQPLVGIRIASVPEPTAIAYLATAATALLLRSRRPLGWD